MSLLVSLLGELFGLFVDDGSLALQIVGLIALVTAAVKLAGLAALWGAGLLLVGCLVILALSLRRMLDR